jgi:pimeloyl-ACP methyl ester carboxylesterase
METIEAAGLRFAFERAGDGPPLVLLHGLPGDRRLWRRQLDSLADEYTVVAWDAPGCGRSSAPAEDFGIRDVARYLMAFIQALGLEQPHVLGLSWGGGVALELYRTAPNIPKTLLLASTYAGWAGSLAADAVAQRLNAYVRAAGMPREEAMRGWAPGFFSPTVSPDLVGGGGRDRLGVRSTGPRDPRAFVRRDRPTRHAPDDRDPHAVVVRRCRHTVASAGRGSTTLGCPRIEARGFVGRRSRQQRRGSGAVRYRSPQLPSDAYEMTPLLPIPYNFAVERTRFARRSPQR